MHEKRKEKQGISLLRAYCARKIIHIFAGEENISFVVAQYFCSLAI